MSTPLIGEGGFDLLSLILLLGMCCLAPSLLRSQSRAPRDVTRSDTWSVTSEIQETYDQIVKEVDDWQEKALLTPPKGRFSFLSRNKRPNFIVDEANPPRLYRLKDKQMGSPSFELAEIVDGGTFVTATYNSKLASLVQDLKAKMLIVPSTRSNTCPSCGKEMMPDFKSCPYCGKKLQAG